MSELPVVHFVHCTRCLLPSSPSGRRVLLEAVEVRGPDVQRACDAVFAARVEAAHGVPR